MAAMCFRIFRSLKIGDMNRKDCPDGRQRSRQARAAALADAEMTKLYADTGIDLSMLPAVIKPDDLAPVMGTSVSALAQDRFRHRGIPYVKFGRRVRYLRADVARYLAANRSNPPGAAPSQRD